jgi:signal transduction histidine kinase
MFITEQTLRKQNATLVQLATILSADIDLDQTLKEITKASAETLETSRVGVWLYNSDASRLTCECLYEKNKNYFSRGWELEASDYPVYFSALKENRAIASSHASEDPRTAEFKDTYLSVFDIASMLDSPIRHSGKIVGVVCHENQEVTREWTPEEENFSASIADLVSLALVTADLKLMRVASRKKIEEERRYLEKELLDIAEREQQRIGQDLHDGLGQQLTGIALLSKALGKRLSSGKSIEASKAAAQIVLLVNDAIKQSRALARGLNPVAVEEGGLITALSELAMSTAQLFKIQCELEADPGVQIYNNETARHLYYLTREAVNNAIKHGKAKHIAISLIAEGLSITLEVRNDGINFPEKHETKGMGLRIMNYRAKMINGSLKVAKDPAGGTIVACTFNERTSSKR